MKIDEKIKNTKERLLNELENSLGIVTIACKVCNVSRGLFYKYYNEDIEFKERADEISEQTIDFAEDSLFRQIKSGDTTATIFYLKTKGKKRGYIEKQEHDLTTNGKEINFDPFSKIRENINLNDTNEKTDTSS